MPMTFRPAMRNPRPPRMIDTFPLANGIPMVLEYGLFNYLDNMPWSVSMNSFELNELYFFGNSGYKRVSRFYRMYLERNHITDENGDYKVGPEFSRAIARHISQRFQHKWQVLWEAFNNELSPLMRKAATTLTTETNSGQDAVDTAGTVTTTVTESGTENVRESPTGRVTNTETYKGSENINRDAQTALSKIGSETTSTQYEGEEHDDLEYIGKETVTDTKAGTESVTRSGNKTIGRPDEERQYFGFDSTAYQPHDKTTYNGQNETETYNDIKDETAFSDDRKDTSERTFGDGRADNRTKQYKDRKDTTKLAYSDDRQDTESVLDTTTKSWSDNYEHVTETEYFNRSDSTTKSFEDRATTTETSHDGDTVTTQYGKTVSTSATTTSSYDISPIELVAQYIELTRRDYFSIVFADIDSVLTTSIMN